MTISSIVPAIPVTTYTGQGCADVNELVRQIVNDLTGNGTPVSGTAASHMTLVYQNSVAGTIPIDFTQPYAMDPEQDYTIVLESTTNVDPFARANVTIDDAGRDPWRICFQTYNWRMLDQFDTVDQKFIANKANDIKIRSLAVYVGTPATLYTPDVVGTLNAGQGANIKIAYRQELITSTTKVPDWFKNAGKTTFNKGYTDSNRYNFVEPIGNTGNIWAHPWDPITTFKEKTGDAPSPTPQGGAAAGTLAGDGPDVSDLGQLFVNRFRYKASATGVFGGAADDVIASDRASPMSYRTVLTDHGVFLSVWGENPEELATGFSWLLVQRSVDKKTGIVRGVLPGFPNGNPLLPGNRPLFCVNSVDNKFYKFVVREHDLPVPSLRKDAAGNDEDSGAVINAFQQQSLTENGEYVITFLNNLNSSRFKYADELDMLGTVSADVVGGGSDIEVNVYAEQDVLHGVNDPVTGLPTPFPSKRRYHALWPSGQFGTKMRIMVVADTPFANTDI